MKLKDILENFTYNGKKFVYTGFPGYGNVKEINIQLSKNKEIFDMSSKFPEYKDILFNGFIIIFYNELTEEYSIELSIPAINNWTGREQYLTHYNEKLWGDINAGRNSLNQRETKNYSGYKNFTKNFTKAIEKSLKFLNDGCEWCLSKETKQFREYYLNCDKQVAKLRKKIDNLSKDIDEKNKETQNLLSKVKLSFDRLKKMNKDF